MQQELIIFYYIYLYFQLAHSHNKGIRPTMLEMICLFVASLVTFHNIKTNIKDTK